jgi:hypothetical protein
MRLFSSCIFRALLLIIAVTFGFGCDTSLNPSNPYDPDTSPDLQKKATLVGTVSGSANNGPATLLEGALVQLHGPEDPGPAPVVTPTDGSFAFTDLVPGSYILETTHFGHVSQMKPIILKAGASLREDIILIRTSGVDNQSGRLTGQAVLAAQLSLPQEEQDHSGILVEVEGAGIRAYTNPKGTFDLYLSGGVYSLLFSAVDHLPTRRDEVAVAAGLDNQLTESPVVLAANPGTISGVILLEGLESGNLQDSTISLSAGNALTIADGSFIISDVAPGSYTLNISHAGYDTQTLTYVRVNGGKQTVIPTTTLAISRGSVSGNATKTGAGNHAGIVVELSGTAHTAVTNSQGDFVLDRVPVGVYELVARHDGYLKASQSPVVVEANQDTQLDPLPLSVWQVSFSINNHAPYTLSEEVSLALSAPEASFMRISEDPSFFDAAYIPFTQSHNTQLSALDGRKDLYVQFETVDGIASEVISSSIILDTAEPTGALVVIDSGATYTTDAQGKVSLALSAFDLTSGIASYTISNDGVFDSETPVAFSQTVTEHFLADPLSGGPKTVSVIFTDHAGNTTSLAVEDSIILDNQVPTINTFQLNNGGANELTNNNVIQVLLDISDDVSGQVSVALFESALNCQTATYSHPPQGVVSYTLVPGDGIRGLNLCAKDAAGNYTMSTASDNALELDTQGPAIPDLMRTFISDVEIGLSWSTTSDAQSYVLQRRREGEGSFSSLAWPGAGINSYIDTIDTASQGKRHYYRIQAFDLIDNPSGFSIELDAGVPIRAPQLVYINGEQQRSLYWDLPQGTSLSLATYAWEDSAGSLTVVPLALNATVYPLDLLDGSKFNERLTIRTNNSDNSLSWDTEYRFGNQRFMVARTSDEASYGDLIIDNDDIVHFCYYDNINGKLKYMKLDKECYADINNCPILLDENGYTGGGCDLGMGADGTVHVAYQEYVSGQLRYMKLDQACLDDLANCPLVVEATDQVGLYISIDIDSADNPHIVYYDSGNQRLKYAKLDGACLADIPNCPLVLDEAGSNIRYMALALDAQDTAHIAYFHVSGYDLKYMKLDATCLADLANCPQIIDGAGTQVGTYVDMRVNQEGVPHILYWAVETGNPRYMILDSDCWADLVNCPIDLFSENIAGSEMSTGFDRSGIAHMTYFDMDDEAIYYLRLDEGCLNDLANCPKTYVASTNDYEKPHATIADRFGNVFLLYWYGAAQQLLLHKLENPPYKRPIMDVGIDGGIWDYNLVMGVGDIPHLAYNHAGAASPALYYDQLDSLSEPIAFATGSKQALKMAVDSSNTPHVVFADMTASPGETWYMKLDDACFADLANCPVVLDDVGYNNGYYAIAIDNSDTPHVVYIDGVNDMIRYAYLDSTCLFDPMNCPIDLTSTSGGTVQLALDLDSNDIPHISYVDENSETLHYIKLDSDCLNDLANCPQLLSDTNVGLVTDLKVDSNDIANVLSYDMAIGYYIVYQLGTQTAIIPIDGPFGEYAPAALALEPQTDIINLIYYVQADYSLHYTRLDGFSPPLIIDSEQFSGTAHSLALDSQGTPHIYYYSYYGLVRREARYLRGPLVRYLSPHSQVQN